MADIDAFFKIRQAVKSLKQYGQPLGKMPSTPGRSKLVEDDLQLLCERFPYVMTAETYPFKFLHGLPKEPAKILDRCRKSPFGDLTRLSTVVDEKVRLAYEIPGAELKLTKEGLKALELLVPYISAGMFDGRDIELKINKLNVYPPDGHFSLHCDTPQEGMLGTLVVELPIWYRHGQLVIYQHKLPDKENKFPDKQNKGKSANEETSASEEGEKDKVESDGEKEDVETDKQEQEEESHQTEEEDEEGGDEEEEEGDEEEGDEEEDEDEEEDKDSDPDDVEKWESAWSIPKPHNETYYGQQGWAEFQKQRNADRVKNEKANLKMHFIVFYGDSPHKVRKVSEGHRVTVTFYIMKGERSLHSSLAAALACRWDYMRAQNPMLNLSSDKVSTGSTDTSTTEKEQISFKLNFTVPCSYRNPLSDKEQVRKRECIDLIKARLGLNIRHYLKNSTAKKVGILLHHCYSHDDFLNKRWRGFDQALVKQIDLSYEAYQVVIHDRLGLHGPDGRFVYKFGGEDVDKFVALKRSGGTSTDSKGEEDGMQKKSDDVMCDTDTEEDSSYRKPPKISTSTLPHFFGDSRWRLMSVAATEFIEHTGNESQYETRNNFYYAIALLFSEPPTTSVESVGSSVPLVSINSDVGAPNQDKSVVAASLDYDVLSKAAKKSEEEAEEEE